MKEGGKKIERRLKEGGKKIERRLKEGGKQVSYPNHVQRPPRAGVQPRRRAESAVAAVVLDAGTNEGRGRPHGNAGEQGTQASGGHTHVYQCTPKRHQQHECFGPQFVTAPPGFVQNTQPFRHPSSQDRVKFRRPICVLFEQK